MHHSSTSEMKRPVIDTGIVRSCCRVNHDTIDTTNEDCLTRLNKPGVLVMLAEATAIHAMRSSTAATNFTQAISSSPRSRNPRA
ncbi:hypothetical protein TNCV_3629781 [Trichonephila clavipes]|nr:hypothetical protein TNCV_3629781 [Trichonephila clavipes]